MGSCTACLAPGDHGATTIRVAAHLDPFVEAHDLGQVFAHVGFWLFADRSTMLFPDVSFVRKERLPNPEELERFLNLVPDLAIEIFSPTDYPKLLGEKIAAYAEAHTPMVWVLYPRTKTVEFYRDGRKGAELGPDEMLDGGDALPGFSVRVRDLFPS
jgi:Uma2 family endonuclease